jgi:Domain of unknown function (DUF3597)
MGLLGSIVDRIFHHANAASTPAGTGGVASAPASGPTSASASTAGAGDARTSAPASASQPRLQAVDVEAVLTQLASKKGGGGNWRTSIVDLLKLLDLDSSLSARKELGNELNVHAGADGSAEQNIALQKAVMAKLAENGGKVPDSLRH